MATRRRAFGSIRQVGRTSWEASYKVEGQRFKGPKTFLAKADASAWLANVQADINRGLSIDPTGGTQTLGEFASGWLDRARTSISFARRSGCPSQWSRNPVQRGLVRGWPAVAGGESSITSVPRGLWAELRVFQVMT